MDEFDEFVQSSEAQFVDRNWKDVSWAVAFMVTASLPMFILFLGNEWSKHTVFRWVLLTSSVVLSLLMSFTFNFTISLLNALEREEYALLALLWTLLGTSTAYVIIGFGITPLWYSLILLFLIASCSLRLLYASRFEMNKFKYYMVIRRHSINAVFPFSPTSVRTILKSSILLQSLYFFLLGSAVISIDQTRYSGMGYVFLLVSGLWTFQVFIFINHFCLSGVFLRWYYSRDDAINPSHGSRILIRALSSSFGSICKAAVLAGVAETFRLLRSVLSRGKGCFHTFDRFIDRYLGPYNASGVSLMTVTGESLSSSCRRNWEAFHNIGVDTVVKEDLLPFINFILSFGMASVNAFVVHISLRTQNIDNDVVLELFALSVGFAAADILNCSETSLNSSIYCGFAQYPSRLFDWSSLIFHRLTRLCEFGTIERFREDSISMQSLSIDERFFE